MKYGKLLRWIVRVLVCLVVIIVLFGLLAHTLLFTDKKELSLRSAELIRVATYNVHYIAANRTDGRWSLTDWEDRKEPLSRAVDELDADVIGFQEMETFHWPEGGDENLTLDWLLTNHPEYTAGAIGDPNDFPSTQPIFYRHDRFNLINQGWFFFSKTPDVIYSRTFNGSFPAFASWIELEEIETKKIFKVVNIHTDFSSYSNRRQSLELVATRVTPWLDAGEAVLVIGDFNAWRESRLHEIIKDTGLYFVPLTVSTYHFNHGLHLMPAIDHVAYSMHFDPAVAPVVLQKKFLGKWPTDHHPIIVDFLFR